MRDIPGPTSFYFRNQEVHYHRISSRRSASHFSQQTIAPFATSGPKLNHQPSKKKQIPTSATFSQTLRPSPPRSNGVKWRFSEGGPPTERERNTFAPPPYCEAHFSCFFFFLLSSSSPLPLSVQYEAISPRAKVIQVAANPVWQ